jgi:hypothetical protein
MLAILTIPGDWGIDFTLPLNYYPTSKLVESPRDVKFVFNCREATAGVYKLWLFGVLIDDKLRAQDTVELFRVIN